MQFYRCKCGGMQAHSSHSMPACAGCPACGTTLAVHPGMHKTPEPHDWMTERHETFYRGTRTVTTRTICARCQREKAVPDVIPDPSPHDTKPGPLDALEIKGGDHIDARFGITQ